MCSEAISDKKNPSARQLPAVLVFHKLQPRFSYSSTNYSPNRLKKLVNYLTGRGYRLASIEDALASGDRPQVAVSFDDGYGHLAENLPELLSEFGLQPVVFMPTAFIGQSNRWDYSYIFQRLRHLDVSQIKRLSEQGVEFGAHGHSHHPLTRLSSKELTEELATSKSILEGIIGREVTKISYPFGQVNARVKEAAASAGFRAGFTMEFPTESDDPLALGRYAVYGYDTCFTVEQKTSGGAMYRVERMKARFTNRLSRGTGLYRRLFGR